MEGESVLAGVADKARTLYGERYAEFLDPVQAYAYYPDTVAKDVQDFRGGEITVRFEGLSGRIDQGAGHDLKVRINGTKVEGYLDGKLYLEHTLSEAVSGRIGLWSKADSYMHFSDYTVTQAN